MTNKNRFQRGTDLTDRFSPEAQAARDELADEAPTATTKRAVPSEPKTRAPKELLPWEAPEARSDLKRPIILRLSDVDMRKLDWIVEHGGAKSKHSFLLKLAQAAIDNKVVELQKKQGKSDE